MGNTTPDLREVARVHLTAEDADGLAELADNLIGANPEHLEHRMREAALLAHELPRHLRTKLVDLRLHTTGEAALIVAGLPINERRAEPTPDSLAEPPRGAEATRAAAILLLIGSVLGDPISYYSQHRGRLVLDVFPIEDHRSEQLGTSSAVTLEWHSEDAFHPLRADWILLLAMRNPDSVPTTFAAIGDLDLDSELRDRLFEPDFVILPDVSHSAEFNESASGIGSVMHQSVYASIESMRTAPSRIAIFSGDRQSPMLRIDPAFMPMELQEADATPALSAVCGEIERRLRDIVIRSGELLIIDNKRAVHGRRPFSPRYDGTDRWLRRVNVIADLRIAEGRRFAEHRRALV